MAALQSPYAASDALLLDFGLQAIASLAGNCPANQAQLAELGACAGTLRMPAGRLTDSAIIHQLASSFFETNLISKLMQWKWGVGSGWTKREKMG